MVNIDYLKHIPAVYFNYPPFALAQDPLIVSEYSFIMSSATTPYYAKELFGKLKKPYTLYIGSDDEQMIPEQVIAYKQYAHSLIDAAIIPSVKHLSLLIEAPRLIAQSIKSMQDRKIYSKIY